MHIGELFFRSLCVNDGSAETTDFHRWKQVEGITKTKKIMNKQKFQKYLELRIKYV